MRKLIFVLAAGMGLMAASFVDAQPKPDAAPAAAVEKAVPATQPVAATPPVEPKDVTGAIDTGKQAIEAAKTGHWWYFSSLVCLIIMFVLKAVKVLDKIGRWKYVILPVLSLAAALLAAFQGGVGWSQAIGVFSTTWSAGMLQQLVNHGILGKPHA